MSRVYPPEVLEFITANYKGKSHADLAEETNRACGTAFTRKSMNAYLANHKLRTESRHNPRPNRMLFTPEEVAFIAEHNTGRTAKEVADLVNATFGTCYTAEQIKAHRARHHLISGLTGFFEKGHTPYNKGVKRGSCPGMIATQFKKGQMPPNHKPVGSERVNCDGYRERKIAEPKTWRAVHVLNWEAVHGPVKKGYVVILKDGDKTNLDISNLLLVSRAELAVMNKRGLISSDPALTEAGQMVAKLVLAASKKKKTKGKEKNG